MPDRWDVVESPSGTGHLIPKDGGETIEVRYKLQVFRRMLPAGAGEFVPGALRIEGKIRKPNDQVFALRTVGKYFTLSLKDGRKLDFFFWDQDGSIANTGPGLYSDPV
jgi:hypothetical protein